MIKIIKGYKQGRAVMFYDIADNNSVRRVSKDEIVKMCEQGKVFNAKIQWWEGKAIVRVKGDILIEKIGSDCNSPVVKIDRQVKNNIKDSGKKVNTIENLFDTMAEEFKLSRVDEYKKNISKKIDISKCISEIPQYERENLKRSLAVYLMNMANLEIRDTYLKYYEAV